MNRLLVYILVVACFSFIGCDTANNVPVRNENFFIKLYAGKTEGNQVGTDIIEASDGGLVIVGTSFGESSSELLLIKTDSKGNEEWTFGADTTLQFQSSVGKSVIELPDGYVVGGTINNGTNIRSLLLKINFDGTFTGDSATVITQDINGEQNNSLSKVTMGNSGMLVSGETNRLTAGGAGGINGYIRLYDPNTFEPDTIGRPAILYFGGTGDDRVAGAYEVLDLVNNLGSNQSQFLVFGSTSEGLGLPANFYYAGIQDNFTVIPSFGSGKVDMTGDQSANYLTRFNDRYILIGSSISNTSRIFLVGWEFTGSIGNDWNTIAGSGEISTREVVVGKGAAVQSNDNVIIVGDEIITQDVNTQIYLAGVSKNFSIESQWPRKFGTNSSTYSSSAVTVLQDGSIVMVGTADLEPIKKIIVIKTGPDGQMSF